MLKDTPSGGLVYLVGIGGCGMSGLAHLLLDAGYTVAGSDVADNQEIQQLRSRGVAVHWGHAAAHVQMSRPFLVAYTSAVRRDNPELLAAEQLQVPIVRRAILLAALLSCQRGICVAGMHGKTTTSAWLAFALERLQVQPSYAVGAAVPQLARHARLACADAANVAGDGRREASILPAGDSPRPWFVIEADESDGTLRTFRPEHAIVLNVDEEHLDYYANFEAICDEFETFAGQTRGHLVFCADDANLVQLFAGMPRAVSYGFNPLAHYRIEMQAPEARPSGSLSIGGALRPTTRFEVWQGAEKLGDFTTRLVGARNVSNAGAIIALLHQMGFDPQRIAMAMASFTGAARRQEELFRDECWRVFDDYGHHPEEITATLRALKGLGCRRLLVAFQPHRFTRTRDLLARFATSFREADRLWLTEIYAASEPAIAGINGALLADTIRAQGQPVEYVPALRDLPAAVRAAMQPGDLVLFLGAGDITCAAHELARQLGGERAALKARLFEELARQLSAPSVLRQDEPLAKRTTLRVGGPADFYVEPATEEDLAEVIRFCRLRKLPFRMLGRGSNLLVRDGGFRGVVLCLAGPLFSRVEVGGERLRCGAGAKLKAVANEAKRHGLGGLEFLEGIPGSVGGALRMNAGAMGAATFEVLEAVRYMDDQGQIHERPVEQVEVRYRSCPFFKEHIALEAVFRGVPASREAIEQRMQECSRKRWDSQPAAPSAGCMFKNPTAIPAGKLIDELGLKGTRVGGARVSEEHGNFLVNDGNATAQDVLALIEIIKERAKSERGINLETEVEILGE